MSTLEDNTIDKEIEVEPEKTLEYYMANPDEMPEDIESINNLQEEGAAEDDSSADNDKKLEANDTGQEQENKQAENKDADDKAGKDDKGGDVDESQRPDILAKNGKDVLPFGVLEGTRGELKDTKAELSDAKTALSDTETQLKELQSELDSLKEDAKSKVQQEKDLHDGNDIPLLDDGSLDLKALREVYEDDVVDAMEIMHKQTQSAVSQTQSALKKIDDLSEKFENVVNERKASEASTESERVQDAIDSVPFVAEIQAKGGDDWATAVAIDKSLRLNPLWSGKGYEDRFKEVARQMGYEDKATTTTDGDLDEKVNKALKGADKATPKSLSDLDGGEYVDVEGIESGASLSVTQTEAKVENMSPEELDNWLAGTG